ncbi:MAG: hypothetical protein JXR36_01275 [Bacteroidales bacterium]|nr:hypothetical protein [Bacteroidales bacterium]
MALLRFVGADVLGVCPAQVYMDNGLIEINADVWDKYSDFEKEFIIAHERGHYELQTDSETEADKFALNAVYGKAPKSLKRSILALHKVGVIDNARFRNLYIEALKIDAYKNNNQRAIKELKTLGINKMRVKKNNGTSPFISKGKNRVDGDQNAASAATLAQEMRDRFTAAMGAEAQTKKTGFTIKDHFISYEVVLLAVLAVLMLKK